MAHLADTSAWIVARRTRGSTTSRSFLRLVEEGLIATCDMVRLELLARAPNAAELEADRAALAALPDCPIHKPQWERALDVYAGLVAQGGAHQLAVGHADLLIAAAAEAAGAALLHYDSDYDRITALTEQPSSWILPRGSL